MARKDDEEDFEIDYPESEPDETYADVEAKSGKKRKKDSKKLKKRKKQRVSRDEDEETENLIHDIEDELEPASGRMTDMSVKDRHTEDEFDDIMLNAGVIKRKGAAEQRKENIRRQSEDASRMLLERMKEAAIKDEEAISEGRNLPSHKLKMCGEVKNACSRKVMQPILISDGLLNVFSLWLTRSDNSTELPNLTIRSMILEILLDLPTANENKNQKEDETTESGITVDALKSSQIGKFVRYFANHPNEIASNKRLAEQIIIKWTRLINNIPESYSESSVDHRVRQPIEDVKKITDQKNPQFSIRARVPRKQGFDFIKRPTSKVVDSKGLKEKVSERQKRLNKMLKELGRRK